MKLTDKQKILAEMVLAKLAAEGVSITDNWAEIEKVLRRTVNPTKCIEIAKKVRK
jgi:hypothetical protein